MFEDYDGLFPKRDPNVRVFKNFDIGDKLILDRGYEKHYGIVSGFNGSYGNLRLAVSMILPALDVVYIDPYDCDYEVTNVSRCQE